MADVKIDKATLEAQETPLTEEQNTAIALAAMKEVDDGKPAVEPEEKKPEEKKPVEKPVEDEGKPKEDAPKEETVLSDEELLSTEDEGLSDVQKTKKVELVKGIDEEKVKIKQEEDDLIAKEDADLSDEDKTKKADIVTARADTTAKDTETEIKAYAEEHKVTEDEARADLESIAKIQEKYKDDPKQLAKANLHLQRLYSKTEEDAKTQRNATPPQEVTVDAVEKAMADGEIVIDGKKVSQETTIEAYRKAYPDLTEELEDSKVLKLAAKDFKQAIDKRSVQANVQVSVKAQEKRSSMYDSISKADERFIPDAKSVIEKLSDAQVAHDTFDVNTYIQYVKGNVYDSDIKKISDEKKDFGAKEYKRGLQEAKILGTKRAPDGKTPVKGTTALTDAQKKRAEEMYDNPDITKEKAYELYADYLKDEKQGE